MGGNLSFTCDADSVAEPGKKSVLSDPIQGVPAEKLFAGFEKFVRDGKTATGKESKFELVEKDGGILAEQHFDIPAFLGGGSPCARTHYLFDAGAKQVKVVTYPDDAFYERGTPSSEHTLVVHSDPVFVEFWIDFLPLRSSGKMIRFMLGRVVEGLGSSAKCHAEAPSITHDGLFSVVTDPIEDSSASPETFLDKFRAFIVEDCGATELPDGTFVEDRGGMAELLGVPRTFAKHFFDDEAGHLMIYEYGEDETLSDLHAIQHVQVHKDPFRLEQWAEAAPVRRAGSGQLALFEPWVKDVLKSLEEEG